MASAPAACRSRPTTTRSTTSPTSSWSTSRKRRSSASRPTGIKTSDAEYAFDIIIYATGFDAITGAFDRIDFRGVDGLKLKEKWKGGPQTYLGILVDGFPNMMMLMGPHTALGNIPRSIEYSVDWVTDLLRHARERDLTRIEATPAGVQSWTDHVKALGVGLLVQRDRFVDDRHQPQCRGQDHAASSPATAAAPRPFASAAMRWRPTGIGSSGWVSSLLGARHSVAVSVRSEPMSRLIWPSAMKREPWQPASPSKLLETFPAACRGIRRSIAGRPMTTALSFADRPAGPCSLSSRSKRQGTDERSCTHAAGSQPSPPDRSPDNAGSQLSARRPFKREDASSAMRSISSHQDLARTRARVSGPDRPAM